MTRHRLLAVALLLVGSGVAACDPYLGAGFTVENHTDLELHFEVKLDTGPYTVVALAPPHEDYVIIGASLFDGEQCLETGVVAYAPDGHEVARLDGPICFDDRWVIGADESASPPPSN